MAGLHFTYCVGALIVLALTPSSWEREVKEDSTSYFDVCLRDNEKEAIKSVKVDKEIFPMLKGKTFMDVWRRKETSDYIDCSMIYFSPEGTKLRVRMHNVDHQSSSLFFNELWTEEKGEGIISSTGLYKQPGRRDVTYAEHMQVFYVDEYVFGYFTCTMGENYWKLVISVWKDKLDDAAAQESLKKAEAAMKQMSSRLTNDQMVKLSRDKCPKNVENPIIKMM